MNLDERVYMLNNAIDSLDKSKKLMYEDLRLIGIQSRMTELSVTRYLKRENVDFESLKEGKARVAGEMMDNGLGLKEISKFLNLSENSVANYAKARGIQLPRGWYSKNPFLRGRVKKGLKETRFQIIEEALKEGVISLEIICKRAGIKNGRLVYEFCQGSKEFDFFSLEPYGTDDVIDQMIKEGRSLGEMAGRGKGGCEGVRKYILYSGQKSLWIERRGDRYQTKKR